MRNDFTIRCIANVPNEPIEMAHQCTKKIILVNLEKKDIFSNRNKVWN